MSVSYINYKGKKVLFADYTKCKNTQDMLIVLEETKKEFEKSNQMILIIDDFTGNTGSIEFMQRAKQLGKEIFDNRTSKAACLGITGIKKILLNGYNTIVKNKLVPFETKEEALEYLVK
jgi:hypothetical protein